MSKVKLMIELPEEIYESVQNNFYCGISNFYCGISNSTVYNAIKNGIPVSDKEEAAKEDPRS